MGFGGNSFASQDQSLVQSMLGQLTNLTNTQNTAAGQTAASNQSILDYFKTNLNQMEGATKAQQKKSVNLGVMDYIKTSPAGLTNSPNTGLMSLL